jgi:hypothetical protein
VSHTCLALPVCDGVFVVNDMSVVCTERECVSTALLQVVAVSNCRNWHNIALHHDSEAVLQCDAGCVTSFFLLLIMMCV